MPHKIIRISIGIGLIVGFIGCATPDATMDLAIRQQEAATFERLAHSNSDDIAESARTLARGRQ
jgi:hypothetical protein